MISISLILEYPTPLDIHLNLTLEQIYLPNLNPTLVNMWTIFKATALVALVAIPQGDFNWPHMPWWEFDIEIARYSTNDCADDSLLSKPVEVRHGNCHSWDKHDDYVFYGLAYIWSKHTPKGEDPTSYGTCRINVWDNTKCEGEPQGAIHNVRDHTDQNFHDCADSPLGKPVGDV